MASSNMTAGKRLTSAVVATVVSVAVVTGLGLLLHKLSADPNGTLVATKEADTITLDGKVYPKASLTMGVYADKEQAHADGFDGNKNDWVQFGPSNHLILPANTYVTITIHGYDGGEKLNNPFFGKVVGTVGGTMNVDGVDVSSIPAEQVQHTFTIHGLPSTSQDPLFVNIPLQHVDADENDEFLPTKDPNTNFKGHTITFSFLTKSAGQYVWNCEYPCGDETYAKFGAAMSGYGYMSGKVTVTA
jgi:hypothetical protein